MDKKQHRRIVYGDISHMYKSIFGKGATPPKAQLETLINEIIAFDVPAAGFVRYVHDMRGANFHFKSILLAGLVPKYKEYCEESSFNVCNRVKSMLTTFENKRKYLSLEKLLAVPRHDMTSIVRWCLAQRMGIEVEDRVNFLALVKQDLKCYPWYYTCEELLPELKGVGVCH